MLNVENIIEQYKSKGGSDDRIVYEILTSSSDDRKNWLASIISQYNDLSKLSFTTLVDIKHDKNINIEIPKNKLVVMTGVSGSGKSSLAFDTIYAEGQRRYVESLSAYARQFLG